MIKNIINPRKSWLIYFFLLIIYFLFGINTIENISPTYDEPVQIACGYSYWKTSEFRFYNIYYHPPFANQFATLPLVFLNPNLYVSHPYFQNSQQHFYADLFLYRNRISAEKIVNSTRLMILSLSCFLGFFVFLWSKSIYKDTTGLIVSIFYFFSSNIIAHSTVTTTDIAVTCFLFLSVYFFYLYINSGKLKYNILCAIVTSIAVCSKFSGLILFPIYFLIFFIEYKNTEKFAKKIFRDALFFVFIFIFLSAMIYKFSHFKLFFQGIKYLISDIQQRGRSSFFFGMYSTTGWRHYFLVLFLVKTPIPFLLLLFGNLFLSLKKKSLFRTREDIFLLIPPAIILLAASFSKLQIGLRHILPVYPFLFVWTGNFVEYLLTFNVSKTKHFLKTICLIFLITWYIISFLKIHPCHISYFNEIIGDASNGYKYFTDSNIDWGQGLKALGKWFKEKGLKGIYFCYFGTGDPSYYEIKYIPIGFIDNLSPQQRKGDKIEFTQDDKILFAISITNLQATYYSDKKIFDWLKEIEPVKRIAYSIFVYDLTDNPAALKKLADIFYSVGNVEQANSLAKRSKLCKKN